MKKLTILVLLIFPAIFVSAQREYLPKPGDLEKFFKTKTLVVLDDNPVADFNFEIQQVMKAEWKLTEFEFINFSDFEAKSKDEKYSFIYTSILNFEKDRTDTKYIFLHLSLGGDNLTLDDLRDMVSVPLGFNGEDPGNYLYKLKLFVRFMQNHVNMISKEPGLVKNNILNHYNINKSEVQNKLLYIMKEDLPKDFATETKIKQVYNHKFKIVTKEEIQKAIEEGDENVVFLHKVGPKSNIKEARCFKIIVGAGDAVFYYYHYHRIFEKSPNSLLKSDFAALN